MYKFHTIREMSASLNITFVSPNRLSGRNDVTTDKANVRPDIRKTFFLKKIRTSRVCAPLKTIWSYFPLINAKFTYSHGVCKEHLIFSFTFFA